MWLGFDQNMRTAFAVSTIVPPNKSTQLKQPTTSKFWREERDQSKDILNCESIWREVPFIQFVLAIVQCHWRKGLIANCVMESYLQSQLNHICDHNQITNGLKFSWIGKNIIKTATNLEILKKTLESFVKEKRWQS